MIPTWELAQKPIPVESVQRRMLALLPMIQALDETIVRSGKYVYGPLTTEFERMCEYMFHADAAIATSSGTIALAIALKATGVTRGDEVIVPGLTFISTAYAVSMIGATPIFVDVDPLTLTIDPERIYDAITPKTTAIIPVHLYGFPSAMREILDIGKTHHLKIVEDFSQAHGARYGGTYVGTIADAGAASVYAYKLVSAFGDMGVVLADAAVKQFCLRARDLGRDPGNRDVHHMYGYRARPGEKEAGVAVLTLPDLTHRITQCAEIAAIYTDAFTDTTPLRLPVWESEQRKSAWWRYTVRATSREERDGLKQYLHMHGIGSEVVYPCTVPDQPVYQRQLRSRIVSIEEARKASETVLSLPLFAEMTSDEIEFVIRGVKMFFS